MMVKRTAELKLLEEQYASLGSNLVILYGRRGIGKTGLLSQFMEGRETYYYLSPECTQDMHMQRMNREWSVFGEDSQLKADYLLLFTSLAANRTNKAIFIIDEFHILAKNSPDFIKVFSLLTNSDQSVMIILCSSSVRWIENEMIGYLGTAAYSITSYIKLKEFTFVDFVNRFPNASVEECIYINAILGGIPDYLNEWQAGKPIEENIKKILLNKNNKLFFEPQLFLRQELREPAIYNTILALLSKGDRKLNNLHAKTGFSRAKISVYLKHLIHLDIVEKLIPLGEEGRENAQKGLYRIKDNFLSFWYRFVFDHLSELMLGQADQVYESGIRPYLDEYISEYFADVCMEYLKLMNVHQRLTRNYQWWDRWYGKNGTIDIIARDKEGNTLVGKCLWNNEKVGLKEYYNLLSLSREAGISPKICYLFSRAGFTTEVFALAKDEKHMVLVSLEDL